MGFWAQKSIILINGIWDLKPQYLGTWTTRVVWILVILVLGLGDLSCLGLRSYTSAAKVLGDPSSQGSG